jgi:hypothetical protein
LGDSVLTQDNRITVNKGDTAMKARLASIIRDEMPEFRIRIMANGYTHDNTVEGGHEITL